MQSQTRFVLPLRDDASMLPGWRLRNGVYPQIAEFGNMLSTLNQKPDNRFVLRDRVWPGSWPGHDTEIQQADLALAHARAIDQTRTYGHDSGYFTLGRKSSSHEIGCVGEAVNARFLREVGADVIESVSLTPIGHEYDLELAIGAGVSAFM